MLQFVFEAAIGRSFESDIAIDFMVVMDGPCEGTHMFVRYSYIHSNLNLTFIGNIQRCIPIIQLIKNHHFKLEIFKSIRLCSGN